MRKIIVLMTIAALFALTAPFVAPAAAQEVRRISIEELKGMLGSPDLVVIDVRRGGDWLSSKVKIKGAVREDAERVESWMSKYPKDKTLVFYCA